MATKYSRNDIGSDRSKDSVRAVATLLGVYTALYLAIVGIIHFMTSPDAAAAVAPDVTRTHVVVTTLPVEPFRGAGGLPATHLLDPATGGEDNSRECTTAIDYECIHN